MIQYLGMVSLNKDHHLGFIALVFSLLRRTFGAILLALASLLISIFEGPIVENVAYNISQNMPLSIADLEIFLAKFDTFLFALAVLIFIVSAVIGWLDYLFRTYRLEEFNLKICHGILNREELTIPYRQIQNVDIDRSLIYLIFGISRLTVINASHDDLEQHGETDIVLDPIDKKIAEAIRLELSHKIGVQIVQDDKDERKRYLKDNTKI